MSPLNILSSLLPVLVFLAVLNLLDSYKLVRVRAILLSVGMGGCAAIAAYGLNELYFRSAVPSWIVSRYLAPMTEETLKALYVYYLIRTARTGFLVDSAIKGFAVGTGFALVENVYYLIQLTEAPDYVWLIRGFGTAVMHGGTSAVFGMISKKRADENDFRLFSVAWPGWLAAAALHVLFNHFFLPPIWTAALVLTIWPAAVTVVFTRSEHALKRWLGTGMDTDIELLDLIKKGTASGSRVGRYVHQLRTRFPGETMADLLCYVRLYAELRLLAKGMLMARELGYSLRVDAEARSKFAELRYLERHIGETGMIALRPFLKKDLRDPWVVAQLQEHR